MWLAEGETIGICEKFCSERYRTCGVTVARQKSSFSVPKFISRCSAVQFRVHLTSLFARILIDRNAEKQRTRGFCAVRGAGQCDKSRA